MSIIGINTSYNSIAENVRTSPVPVRRYVVALEDVFLLYRVDRYDIHGKRFLKTREKYYVSDTGIRNTALRLTAENDLGRQLENVVFLKILRRACVLNTEWYRDDEIAFTAEGWGTWWSTTR